MTKIIVQKFGGTSVGSVERIDAVADIIADASKTAKIVSPEIHVWFTTLEVEKLSETNKSNFPPNGRNPKFCPLDKVSWTSTLHSGYKKDIEELKIMIISPELLLSIESNIKALIKIYKE